MRRTRAFATLGALAACAAIGYGAGALRASTEPTDSTVTSLAPTTTIDEQGNAFDDYGLGYRDAFDDARRAFATTTTTQHIEEDDPRWDCATMGNRQCGPTPATTTEPPAERVERVALTFVDGCEPPAVEVLGACISATSTSR